jgi:predicted N-acetyltransferase YhbS
MHSDLEIRPMAESEAEEVSRVVAAAIRADLPARYPREVVEALAAGNSAAAIRTHAPLQTDYVAWKGQRIVAMLGLKRNEIGHLFVHPDFARRGVGRELVAYAAGVFRQTGYRDMIVMSSLNATAFYGRFGFVEEGRGSFDVRPGLPLQFVRMRAAL